MFNEETSEQFLVGFVRKLTPINKMMFLDKKSHLKPKHDLLKKKSRKTLEKNKKKEVKKLRFPLFPGSEGCLRNFNSNNNNYETWGEVPVKGRIIYEYPNSVNPLISQQAFVYEDILDGDEDNDIRKNNYEEEEEEEKSSDVLVKRAFHVTTCGHVIHTSCYLKVLTTLLYFEYIYIYIFYSFIHLFILLYSLSHHPCFQMCILFVTVITLNLIVPYVERDQI
jgi:hypothetical protein